MNSLCNHGTRHKEAPSVDFPSLLMFPHMGRPAKGCQVVTLDHKALNQVHRYILSNCAALQPYREELKTELKRRLRYSRRPNNNELDDMVRMQFAEWFARRFDRTNDRIDDLDIRVHSRGPNPVAFSYRGFNINGFAFRTVESESNKKVQNSGAMVQSIHNNDDHESNYYGRLTDVISLEYGGLGRIFLFRCDWVNITTRMKVDPLGFTMVNFLCLIHTREREEHEPFILASQAQMVYYVRDPKEDEWLLLTMVNKRKQKLIQNIRGQELRDNDLQDEHESHDITSHSQLDTQNGALELDQNEEFTEEMLTSQRQQNRRGRTVMRDVHALDPDDVLVLQFNERGQSYGDIQPVLANFVGTIARNGNLLPLSFLDWRKMPKKCLNDAWRKVTFQEKERKPTRIEIIKISRRSKKRGDAPVDDEVILVEPLLDEAVRQRLQDKPEVSQPTEVHEDAFLL
ncbi:hypothetical protein ZIOFF_039366 [Zingiber officinale]|uniref:DUF4216 domain-containing protein n=1 Tax=Zingiber officinale TaxID=94328 RepID=A0A8J5G4N4_ZINOF|nr:hypothetical protein ZIOFF_039366 [Zingiber officinale]